MSAYRYEPHPDAFSRAPAKYRKPRKEDGSYLKLIRELPCVVCMKRPVEAAHIRTASITFGKRNVGTAEKPDDRWTLPLCRPHHDEQHSGNEIAFYSSHGIDPFVMALALWGARDDPEAMETIVLQARSR